MGTTCGKVNKKFPTNKEKDEHPVPNLHQKTEAPQSPTEQDKTNLKKYKTIFEYEAGIDDRYFSKSELYSLKEKFKDSETIESVPKPSSVKEIRWREGDEIGQGAFGRVILGLNLEKGELMAVKQVGLDDSMEEKVRSLELEIELLSQLKHKNIVQYIGTSRAKNKLNIFLEFIKGGTIIGIVKKFGVLNESLIRRYTTQILEGLEYLHYNKVIHRDIKGGNILVDNAGVCKLTDFGSSKKICKFNDEGSLHQSLRGTAHFMAPEVIKQSGYGRFADIWSVGCTIMEMVTGKPPFSNFTNPITAMFQIAKSNQPPPLPDGLSPELRDFLGHCFRTVPQERYNVFKLLRHPFITGIPLDTMSIPTGGNLAPINEEDDEITYRTSPHNAKLTKIVIVSENSKMNTNIEMNINMNHINQGYPGEEAESHIDNSNSNFDNNKLVNEEQLLRSLMSFEEDSKEGRRKSDILLTNSSDQLKGSAKNLSHRGNSEYGNPNAIHEVVGGENEEENFHLRNPSGHKKKIDFNFEENLDFNETVDQIKFPKIMPNNRTFKDIVRQKKY